ncbi:LysR family transcriptional regulator [Peribacillus muralis]|uniref:LysR family transcriptional regulator n=1 Tax=Peribacillus muralis TaxID=264697 RepID=UPI001F4ECC65|nr:LysR family transcriptional regulator [Peribacillus muralis]MCK1994374.1 LysR family transcriptional regulator [Peribacillus muralis]MCK2014841.1 LysR family transcriptional regulator [Peribacillus muralis]
MNERDWHILKVLHEQKNITKTAQSLYISQPSLTKRIQQMEKEFHLKIVERGARGVQFTPQGEYLANCAEEMLVRLREIKETAFNMGQEISGTLRLGVSNYITLHKLPGLLKMFRERYPLVDFHVTTGWSNEVLSLIYKEEVHVGIVRGDYQWSGAKHHLFEETICIASKEKVAVVDLPSLPRIDYKTDALLKMMIDDWWRNNFLGPPLVGMEVDKGDTCKEMVKNGLGYGIMPSALLENDRTLRQMDLRDGQGNPLIRNTWMLYHEKSLELKLVNEFVRFVEGVDFMRDL